MSSFLDCPETAENVYWWPPNCFDIQKFAATKCDYIVTWEYNLGHDYVQFVVKSKTLDHWTGLGISYGDPLVIQCAPGSLSVRN